MSLQYISNIERYFKYWNNMLQCQPNVTNIGLDIEPVPKRVSTYIFYQYWPNDVCYTRETFKRQNSVLKFGS